MSKFLEIADQVLREIGYQSQPTERDIRDISDKSPAAPLSADDGRDKSPTRPPAPVFDYRLSDKPGAWLVMIGRRGMDLAAARRRLEHQFGSDRVIEVRQHTKSEPEQ